MVPTDEESWVDSLHLLIDGFDSCSYFIIHSLIDGFDSCGYFIIFGIDSGDLYAYKNKPLSRDTDPDKSKIKSFKIKLLTNDPTLTNLYHRNPEKYPNPTCPKCQEDRLDHWWNPPYNLQPKRKHQDHSIPIPSYRQKYIQEDMDTKPYRGIYKPTVKLPCPSEQTLTKS